MPQGVQIRELRGVQVLAQCQGMMTFTELAFVPSDPLAPFTDRLRLAVAAYLARFKGSSRKHTESDLRCYLAWCAEHGLDPLAAQRPHLELYIRSMQEIRRFKPQISGVGLSTTLMTWGFSSLFLCVILKTPVGWVACRQRLRRSWRACQSPVISACTAPAAGASSRAVP